MVEQKFGGSWTEDKLERIKKYLWAYTTIMKERNYRYAYIDVFAGTGYIEEKQNNEGMFEAFNESDTKNFIDGSAITALKINPSFTSYVFVEKHKEKCKQLEDLKQKYPNKDIKIINSEANEYVMRRLSGRKDFWKKHRAVVFLDPYGMQVSWEAIKAMAETKAIDLWYLFPLGVAVNRLLQKNPDAIKESHKERLNYIFGDDSWFEAFYKQKSEDTLFGEETFREKVEINDISNYLTNKLKSIFAGVAEPLPLYSSKNNPLYLLCFAVGNPYAKDTALRIAKHILRK